MRRVSLALALFGVLALLAGPATADEKKAEPKKGAAKASDAAFNFPKQVQLTDDQKAKLEELKKEYGPKLDAIDARVGAIMTPERRKTEAEARKKAAADGKKGKEVAEAVSAALNLPAEDQAKRKEASAEKAKLMKEINPKKMALLTDDQKAQLKPKPKENK
jgi:hypothetical protein